jgi:transketolase, bacterial and yeast
MSNNVQKMAVNAIRVLSADAIEKAKSGHPGLPLGNAAVAYELWANHMNHNPKNPKWENRDRFILSGGHGSMLLYSLFHLFEYGDLSLEEIKNFRQDGSLTPGHPEYKHTVGVEATTGPLGAGMGMAVGMAMAEAHLAATFNKENYPVVDHYTYVLGGDGCMMEGISSEAFSLAGTLGLSKLIVFYDSNKISIEGSTDLAFTEDVQKRLDAYGFQTITVEDGNDLEEISAAIKSAKADKERPTFITVKTQIGYGCPAKQGKASAHGEPLGEDNIDAMKDYLGWPSKEAFCVPEEVYSHYKEITSSKAAIEENWNLLFENYKREFPDMAKLWEEYYNAEVSEKILNNKEYWETDEKSNASRNISGIMLNRLKDIIPNIMGGSADLSPSTKTNLIGESSYSKTNHGGKNIHYGVRELAMAAIGNGITLHGGLKTYVSTFFVFSDYVKPMARLSALMGLPITYVFTHDSIGVGEDGPTHEPVEQLAMWRALPNFYLFRPCDARETAAAWYFAASAKDAPTALVLTRQNLAPIAGSGNDALKGGYIISDCVGTPDLIYIATGSEVEIAIKAKEKLEAEGKKVRVVSMPCVDLFEEQSAEYKEMVLPKTVRHRIAIEAAVDFGWGKYVGLDGDTVTMSGFGASAPAEVLFEKFGFTVSNAVNKAKALF